MICEVEKLISAQSQQQQRVDMMIKIMENVLRASGEKKKKKGKKEGISLQNMVVFEMFA